MASESPQPKEAEPGDDVNCQRLHGLITQETLLPGYRKAVARCVNSDYDIYSILISGALSGSQLSEVFAICFGKVHAVTHFDPDYEPEIGTYICKFCGATLSDFDTPRIHVHSCAKAHYQKELQKNIALIMPAEQPWSKVGCKGKRLDEAGTTMLKQLQHHDGHLQQWHKMANDASYPGECQNKNDNRQCRFASKTEWRVHVRDVHQHLSNGAAVLERCEMCDTWFDQPFAYDEHLHHHLDEALDSISKYGYSGLSIIERNIHPLFCPFCIHDECLPPDERLHTARADRMAIHLGQHALENQDPRLCPCYLAGFCTNSDLLPNEQLVEHLEAVHQVVTAKMAPNKRTKVSDKVEKQAPKRKPVNFDDLPTDKVLNGPERCQRCQDDSYHECRVRAGRGYACVACRRYKASCSFTSKSSALMPKSENVDITSKKRKADDRMEGKGKGRALTSKP